MEQDTFSKTWSSSRYYEVGLVAFTLGLSNSMYLFKNLRNFHIEFLCPYILYSIIFGTPSIILELSIGQYGQKDMIEIWSFCPIFKVIGYLWLFYFLTLLVESLLVISIIARYMLNSFSSELGWDHCGNSWNTHVCYTYETNVSRRLDCYDEFGKVYCDKIKWETSYQQYWFLVVRNYDLGVVQWKSLIYCVGVTLLALALTGKGVKLIEKVIFGLLLIAAIEFTILFVCVLIQNGSGNGLYHFFIWNFNSLSEPSIWIIGIRHGVNSFVLGTGGLISLGSQNNFRGNSYKNGLLILLINITVTVLFTIFYFCLCGTLGYYTNQSFDIILNYDEPEFWSKIPRMLNKLDGPTNLWQWNFYSINFMIILSKILVAAYIVVQVVGKLFKKVIRHFMVTNLIVYLIVFVFTVPLFCTPGKFLLSELIDSTIRGPMILLMNFLQTTIIIYFYGLTVIIDDLHFMMGFRIKFYWQIVLFLLPIFYLTSFVCICYFIFQEGINNSQDLTMIESIVMYIFAFSPIVITFCYALWYVRSMFWTCEWENKFKPDDDWYLKDPILRISRQMFSSMSMTKEYIYRQTKKQEKAVYDFEEDAEFI